MRAHIATLVLLAATPLAMLRPMRKPMLLAYPIFTFIVAAFSGEYHIKILGKFGVSLKFDRDSKIFMIAVSVSFLMIILENLEKEQSFKETFLILTSLLTLSAMFMSFDLFNIYVLTEVLSIQAGLMAIDKKDKRTLWATLKYLIVSGTGASLYLVGIAMVYQKFGDFSLSNPIDPLPGAFITTGLLMRAGTFGLGMWLPQFHSSVSDKLSALFSGSFIGGTILPLWRMEHFANLTAVSTVAPYLAILGSIVPLISKSYKRILAGSTMVHITSMLSIGNPAAYFMSHAVSKTFLFLRSSDVKRDEISIPNMVALLVATSSLSGFPFTLGGFAEGLFHSPILFIGTIISSTPLFSRISKVKSKGWNFSPVSIFPLLLLYPYFSLKSLLSSLAILGIFLKIRNDRVLFLERIEWNVAFSLAFLAGVILFF